jgi:hypothetical protein
MIFQLAYVMQKLRVFPASTIDNITNKKHLSYAFGDLFDLAKDGQGHWFSHAIILLSKCLHLLQKGKKLKPIMRLGQLWSKVTGDPPDKNK